MNYRIKQKIFSLTDSFDIEDENGRTAFTAKGKLFSISSSQTLFDQADNEVLKIKRKYLSLMPACRLINNDGSEWLIKKKFWPFWTSRFSIDTPKGQLDMTGNFWQHEYEIRQQGSLIASISKKLISWSDSYGVAIHHPEWTPQILATVIVIDRIQHKDKNSTFGDD
ncbi:LURP-one-related/scramblase family protein [Alteromonas oceanisediminis]|uniref:LURP-one-related/scramblase family protein n=1 Tax=Alteromonas oceanisediminis TaxID=2836180 RepID=UPI001BD94F9F|nr:LURP-one-related family protein [Alteromonas oceanisediminis]MBT0586175.1 LURP-one-related family protein [Alteromonas oceanisediminis]